MIFRLLGPAGIAGVIVSICLSLLLAVEKGESRHWKKRSARYEQLYHAEQAAFAGTVANYRAAAEAARAADRAAADRAAAAQAAINERTAHEYQSRLAAARAAAGRLRVEAASGAADRRARGAAPMPGVAVAAPGAAQAAGEDRLPVSERLIATEQAIQLDELIKWVRRQAGVRPE